MKFKITEVREIDVDVQFPAYRKSAAHAYKVIDEKTCICVMHGFDNSASITVYPADMAYNNNHVSDCTEEEFNKLYNETVVKLQRLGASWIPTGLTEQSRKFNENIVRSAFDSVCDDFHQLLAYMESAKDMGFDEIAGDALAFIEENYKQSWRDYRFTDFSASEVA